MSGKAVLLGIIVLVTIVSGILAFQEKPTNLPPGIPSSMWIPLSENSGIALRDARSTFDLHGKPVTHGTLMVKVGGSWQRVCLDSAPEIMPVRP